MIQWQTEIFGNISNGLQGYCGSFILASMIKINDEYYCTIKLNL